MGTNVIEYLKDLKESQWWPQDKILELQNQRLQQLLNHAYTNVPYYRQIFQDRNLKPDDIACRRDLAKLPILTKQIIRENYQSLISKNNPYKKLQTKHTTGSTGEPFSFIVEKNKRATWAYASSQRAYQWSGYQIGDKCVFIGQKEYLSTREKVRETIKNFFKRVKIYSVQAISTGNIETILKEIEQFHPEYFWGYPSAIYMLARFLEKKQQSLKLKAIISIAEKVEDYQRNLFKKVFMCETFSLYSANEAPNIAAECSIHNGYHIAAENIVIEIVDNQNMPVPADHEGRILVTNLNDYFMPFIRYDIGDVGAVTDRICPCGRGLPVLIKLEGRVSDTILTRDGRSIPGMALQQRFLALLDGVVQWQIIQESFEKVLLKLVLDNNYPELFKDKLTSEILANYKPVFGDDIAMTVQFVDDIPRTKTGKRRVIISKVS